MSIPPLGKVTALLAGFKGYFAVVEREGKGKGEERKRKWTEGMRDNTSEINF